MGGMYALKSAAAGRFDRVVGFYGMIRVPDAWSGPGQGQPGGHAEHAGRDGHGGLLGHDLPRHRLARAPQRAETYDRGNDPGSSA